MGTTKKPLTIPDFTNEDEEAKWWASAKGRAFLREQGPAESKSTGTRDSALVAGLNKASSVQIALRLPAPDVEQAREIAQRKGIGYQTLLKMLVQEGLQREARRK